MGYITRKPIINKNKKIFAYQLKATKNINFKNIECILPVKENNIFINYKNNQLYKKINEYIPKEKIGIILADKSDNQDIGKILHNSGFLVIDNTYSENSTDILDILKLNYNQITKNKTEKIIRKCKNNNIKLMACNLKNNQEFQKAIVKGFDFFEGNFYYTTNYSQNTIPGFKINYLKLLQQINQTDTDFNKIENIIKNDLSLSYNLFRLINSAYFGLKHEIKSLKQALTLLGLNDLKRWLSIKIMRGLNENKTDILMEKSLIRGHFAENIASYTDLKERYFDLFIMGLFSLIDIFLNKPLPEVVNDLSLAPEVKKALLTKKGEFGSVFDLIIAHEQGKWQKVDLYLEKFNIKQEIYMDCYYNALTSTHQAIQAYKKT